MIDLKISSKTYNVVSPQHPTKQNVIDFQKGIPCKNNTHKEQGRIISSEKLQQELMYDFLFPNPLYF